MTRDTDNNALTQSFYQEDNTADKACISLNDNMLNLRVPFQSGFVKPLWHHNKAKTEHQCQQNRAHQDQASIIHSPKIAKTPELMLGHLKKLNQHLNKISQQFSNSGCTHSLVIAKRYDGFIRFYVQWLGDSPIMLFIKHPDTRLRQGFYINKSHHAHDISDRQARSLGAQKSDTGSYIKKTVYINGHRYVKSLNMSRSYGDSIFEEAISHDASQYYLDVPATYEPIIINTSDGIEATPEQILALPHLNIEQLIGLNDELWQQIQKNPSAPAKDDSSAIILRTAQLKVGESIGVQIADAHGKADFLYQAKIQERVTLEAERFLQGRLVAFSSQLNDAITRFEKKHPQLAKAIAAFSSSCPIKLEKHFTCFINEPYNPTHTNNLINAIKKHSMSHDETALLHALLSHLDTLCFDATVGGYLGQGPDRVATVSTLRRYYQYSSKELLKRPYWLHLAIQTGTSCNACQRALIPIFAHASLLQAMAKNTRSAKCKAAMHMMFSPIRQQPLHLQNTALVFIAAGVIQLLIAFHQPDTFKSLPKLALGTLACLLGSAVMMGERFIQEPVQALLRY